MQRLWSRLSQSRTRRERPSDCRQGKASEEACPSGCKRVLALKVLALHCVLPTVDTVGSSGLSALHVICAKGQHDCLEAVLRSDMTTDLNVRSRKTFDFKKTSEGGITRISCQWCDAHAYLGDGVTSLHLAVLARSQRCVQLLLTRGAYSHTGAAQHHETPLHYACLLGDVEITRLLVDHGASINHCSKGLASPIHIAVAHNNKDCVRFLLERGADPSISAIFGVRPIHYTIRGKIDCPFCICCLTSDRRPVVESPLYLKGDFLTHYACLQGNAEMLILLLKRGTKANQLGGKKLTILHSAALGGSSEVMNLLLVEERIPVSLFDESGCTPLHYAVLKGHYKCAKQLLQHGADPNAVMASSTRTYCHPLGYALMNSGREKSAVKCVKLLLSYGVNAPFYDRSFLLSGVSFHGPDIVRLLLAANADVAWSCRNSARVLFTACSTDCVPSKIKVENVKLLVFAKGVDINQRDDLTNQTSLHACASKGLADVARVLLDAGADSTLLSFEGLTPFETCEDEETRFVFQEYEGKVRSLECQCRVFLLRNFTAQEIAHFPLPRGVKASLSEYLAV